MTDTGAVIRCIENKQLAVMQEQSGIMLLQPLLIPRGGPEQINFNNYVIINKP